LAPFLLGAIMTRLIVFFISLLPLFVFAQAAPNYVPAQVRAVTSVGTVTSSHITVNALAKGFAANDPFRPVVAKVTPANLLKFAKANGGKVFRTNPYWIAATIAMGFLVSDDGSIIKETSDTPDHYYPGYTFYVTLQGNGYNKHVSARSAGELADKLPAEYAAYWGCCNITFSHYSIYRTDPSPIINIHFSGGTKLIAYSSSCNGSTTGNCSAPEVIEKPVSDSDFIDSLLPHIISNPDVKIFGDDMNAIEWEPLEYNPFADNPYNAGLMDLYRQGLLQSSDPNGDYYVTPEKLQEIANAVARQDHAKSPEGQAEALNQEASSPLTAADVQQGYADATTEFSSSTAPVTGALTEKLAEHDKFLSDIPDLVGGNIPGTPSGIPGVPLPVDWATGMTGTCQPLAIDIGIGPFQKTTSWDAHCVPYDTIFRPVIEWFLMIMTALYLFRMWDDTVSKVAGM
jgi:hypothetical protein